MITFIYFDVGGVTIKDFSASNKEEIFERELLKIPPQKITAFRQLFDKYEPSMCTGRNVDDFIPEFSRQLDLSFPENLSILDVLIGLFERNQSLWPVMRLLKSYFKIGLLTNMYPQMLDKIKQANLLPEIEWDVVIDSSLVGVRKPDEKIYQIAETKADCPSSQIMLIDNLQENLDAAQSRGWHTFLYNSTDYEQSSRELANILTHKLLL